MGSVGSSSVNEGGGWDADRADAADAAAAAAAAAAATDNAGADGYTDGVPWLARTGVATHMGSVGASSHADAEGEPADNLRGFVVDDLGLTT